MQITHNMKQCTTSMCFCALTQQNHIWTSDFLQTWPKNWKQTSPHMEYYLLWSWNVLVPTGKMFKFRGWEDQIYTLLCDEWRLQKSSDWDLESTNIKNQVLLYLWSPFTWGSHVSENLNRIKRPHPELIYFWFWPFLQVQRQIRELTLLMSVMALTELGYLK